MRESLTAKQRATAYQNWCSMIMREGRDLADLERIGARALQDRDVRADSQLQSMIQTELGRRRAELQREEQRERENRASASAPPNYRPSSPRQYSSGRRTSRDFTSDFQTTAGPASPTPAPPPPDPDEEALHRLVAELVEALKTGDEGVAQAVCVQLRALRQRRSEILSADSLAQYEQRVGTMRARLQGFRSQIAAMVRDACEAARRGDAAAAAKLVSRLSAIHVTHPRLLDESGLDKIRQEVVAANEGHEDSLTTRRLVERQRATVAKMRRLWAAVNEFHRVVCTVPESSAEFRRAEAEYLQVLQEIRLHDEDWLAEFVLEVADMLAEWSVPPPGAEKQIDRFLEKVRVGIEQIQRKMGEIEEKRDGNREA